MGADELEARVRELEAEVRVLHAMLQSAPDFVTRITTDGNFLYLNRLAPGFQMEQVLGTSIDGYVPEQFRARAHAAMRAAAETRCVQQYPTVGHISADRVGHYLTRVSPVVEGDRVTSLVMIATDVTELEEQRIRLQLAIDASELGIWTHNVKDGSGTWDQRTRRIFGYSDHDAPPSLQQMMQSRVHPDDRRQLSDALARSEDRGHFGPLHYRVLGPKGEARWVLATGIAIRDHEGEVVSFVGTVKDITERRALEERLLSAQKLESIGRLAGGVAHDFNNMLTAVFGNLQFAKESDDLEEVRGLLEDVRVTAERSAALTSQLLAFARKQVIEPHVFDINAMVARLDRVFQRALGAQVRVVIALSAQGHVRADESQIEQVVMNLVTNARDAMPRGGALTLETLDASLSEDYASAHDDVCAGDYVMIAVSDTGMGINADDLPHIFEPFFTTRPGGTGLGLATCYGIVKQNGGHLSVYTELGRGTTFKVYLPRVNGELPAQPPKPVAAAAGAGERILLVEDEDPVRAVLERVLSGNGYTVVSTRSAEEALQAEHAERYDLLITDVILPGIDGRSLAELLSARQPELRVLYVSGYTENAIVHGGELEPGIDFLQKPFVPDDLLRVVRSVLDAKASGRAP